MKSPQPPDTSFKRGRCPGCNVRYRHSRGRQRAKSRLCIKCNPRIRGPLSKIERVWKYLKDIESDHAKSISEATGVPMASVINIISKHPWFEEVGEDRNGSWKVKLFAVLS